MTQLVCHSLCLPPKTFFLPKRTESQMRKETRYTTLTMLLVLDGICMHLMAVGWLWCSVEKGNACNYMYEVQAVHRLHLMGCTLHNLLLIWWLHETQSQQPVNKGHKCTTNTTKGIHSSIFIAVVLQNLCPKHWICLVHTCIYQWSQVIHRNLWFQFQTQKSGLLEQFEWNRDIFAGIDCQTFWFTLESEPVISRIVHHWEAVHVRTPYILNHSKRL